MTPFTPHCNYTEDLSSAFGLGSFNLTYDTKEHK